MKYNYLENIKSDIIDYVNERKEDLKIDLKEGQFNFDALYDDLFIEDSVTGNASGSYYCNTWKAEEALAHNMDLLQEALEMFGESDINALEKGAEWCDVTIRCYLLGQALEELKNEITDILEEEEEGAENE